MTRNPITLRDTLTAVGPARQTGVVSTSAFQRTQEKRKRVPTRAQELQAKRNSLAKQIGELKGKGEDVTAVMAEAGSARSSSRTRPLWSTAGETERLPALHPQPRRRESSPARSPRTTSKCGAAVRGDSSTFTVKDHVDVGEGLGLLDFATAPRFPARAFRCCAEAVACTAPSRSSCSTCIPSNTAVAEVYVPYMVSGECADGVDLAKFQGRSVQASKGATFISFPRRNIRSPISCAT